MKKLDVMDKALIRNRYKEKILADLIEARTEKIKYSEFTERLKRNLENYGDEIQGFPVSRKGE